MTTHWPEVEIPASAGVGQHLPVNRFSLKSSTRGTMWALGLVAALVLAGCAKAADPGAVEGESTGSQSGSGSTSGSSGSGQQASTGDNSTGSGTSGDDSTGLNPPSGDDSSTSSGSPSPGDDSSAPSGDDSSTGTTAPPLFPPFTLPEAGMSSTPDDGGANACTTKICIDPVFDCPLQGCFNGCTNFHCM
jgi:hypothetical protein